MNRWQSLALVAVFAMTVVQLRIQGRLWWCACGRPNLWSGDVWSSHNSQHLFDPYSFTHVIHGILFYGFFAWLCPRWPRGWRLVLASGVEALWEIVENSQFVIDRYRAATVSLDYQGDTIANSVGDILSCLFGFLIAPGLGVWGSVAAIVLIEVVLLFWIRDNLLLNIVMLFHPIDAVKTWQMQH